MQVQTVPEPETLADYVLESLRVLIVDDEPAICDTLRHYFKHMGISSTRTAHSGESAIQHLERYEYDYVFLDINLPEMTGMDVLKKMHEYQSATSVIIMTGYPSMDIVIEAMHSGAADFLVKPFGFQDIKLTMNRIQRLHLLMEKNWLLHQELEKKKEVEELNIQLEKKIKHQTILYNIIDSLSKINRSDDLYQYVVNKAIEYCNVKKACFMLYDQGNSSLLTLAYKGFEHMDIGNRAGLKKNSDGQLILDTRFMQTHFGYSNGKPISLFKPNSHNGFMSVPFNIRNEPFGILLISEKEETRGFDEEDEFILNFLAEKTALNIENIALYDNLKQSLIATLMSLVSAIEAKDTYTRQHSSRVTRYSLKIARQLKCPNEDLQRIKSSAPLHDIGKIGISDNILNKPALLTDEEFKHIKDHPLIGVNIIAPLGLDEDELSIVRNHHERWDGTGYPDGLKRDNIPRLSRILAVADAFDAMNSSRAYRDALPLPICLRELKDNSGTQFDPEVVEAALIVFDPQK